MTSAGRWAAITCAALLAGCVAQAPLAPARAPTSSPKQQARAGRLACETASDCTILPRSCCGQCGAATPGDAVVLNAAWAREHADPWPRCADTGCPRCGRPNDPRLIATCDDHRCTLVDLSRHRVTRCAEDADCTLRAASCCECGATQWVSVRAGSEGAFARLVCESDPAACPACVTPRPSLPTRCVERHCVIASDPLELGVE